MFVDLYKVIRGGLQASVPGYGLKEMEAFLDFRRQAEIKDGGASIVEYERYVQTGTAEQQRRWQRVYRRRFIRT